MADSRLDIDHRCGFCWQFINSTSDPRVLPCKHISCMSCLNKEYEEHKGAECTVCKIFHELTDVADVPKFVPKKSEDTTTWHECDRKGCTDKPVTNFCVYCEHKLCDDHLQTHQAHYGDEHDVVPIHMLVDSPKKYTKIFCEHHKNQEIARACEICQELLCNDCEPSEHCMGSSTGHQISSMSALTEKMDLDYKQLLNSVDGKITAMCESRKQSWKNLDDEEEKCNKWINEIQRIRDEQIEAITEDSRKVIEKVEEYREIATNDTEAFEAELMMKKEKLEKFRGKVHRLTRDEHVTELIRQKQQLIEEMIKNLDVEIGSCKLPGQHELINNSNHLSLNLNFVSSPTSITFKYEQTTNSQCYSASYRENGDLLLGCAHGVRLLRKDNLQMSNFGTTDGPITSVTANQRNFFITKRVEDTRIVEMCLPGLKQRMQLFSLQYPGNLSSFAGVNDRYVVTVNPKKYNLVLYEFLTEQTTILHPDKPPSDVHFLPDGHLLVLSGPFPECLTRYRIENAGMADVWTCEGLEAALAVCTDSDGLIYICTDSSKRTLYIVSPQGEKLQEIKHQQLPAMTGQISIRGREELAVPTWDDKSVRLFNINR